jgi:hypothetical protein
MFIFSNVEQEIIYVSLSGLCSRNTCFEYKPGNGKKQKRNTVACWWIVRTTLSAKNESVGLMVYARLSACNNWRSTERIFIKFDTGDLSYSTKLYWIVWKYGVQREDHELFIWISVVTR